MVMILRWHGSRDWINSFELYFGNLIGIFYFNALPARAFLGNSGSQYLGSILASLGIVFTPQGLPQPSSWSVPILLFSVPIFDTALVIIPRLKRNHPVYRAGFDRINGRLVKLGLMPSQAVVAMHLANILSGDLAVIEFPLWANLSFTTTMLAELILPV